MSSAETPILTADNCQPEEKIRISPQSKTGQGRLIFFIIWCVVAGGMFISTVLNFGIFGIAPLAFFILGIVMICKIENGGEMTINNINHTLSLRKRSLCDCCCKKPPRVIDLTQVEKIFIQLKNDPFGISGSEGFYIITYKNGTTENISQYFNGCKEKCSVDCQNLFRKYMKVSDTNPEMEKIINIVNSNPNVIIGFNPIMNPNQVNAFNAGFQQNYNQPGYIMNVNMNVGNNNSGNIQNAPLLNKI